MSGWDEANRVRLPSPWEEFWIEAYTQPPLGDWLDAREAVAAASATSLPSLDKALDACRRLVKDHNLVDREGKPLDLTLRTMSTSLILAYLTAMVGALGGVGESTAPLSPRTTSPVRSSRRRTSRPASGTGA